MQFDPSFTAIAIETENRLGYVRPQPKPVWDFNDPDLYNSAYVPLFDDESEHLHLFGSAGSGKSRWEAQNEIVKSFDESRRNRKTLLVRKVYSTLANSIYSEIKTVIYEWNARFPGLADCFTFLKSPLQITNTQTNVTFIFIGLDDVEKVKSISGVDRIWIEEATELTSPNELRQLRTRLRGFDRVQIVLSYNPINIYHWLNTEIHEKLPAGHRIFKTTYRDNEKLLAIDPGYATYLESTKETDPNFYRVYACGIWGQNSEGLIYPTYTVEETMPEPQFYGIDFGYNDPTAVVAGAVVDIPNQDKQDLYWHEVIYERHLTSAMLIDRLNDLGVNPKKKYICDNARPEMIADLRKAGFRAIPCKKYKHSVIDGINRVKKFNLKITAGSKNMFREIQNYSWLEKDGKFMDDTPKDGIEHSLDAGRYGTAEAYRYPQEPRKTFDERVFAEMPEQYRPETVLGLTGNQREKAHYGLMSEYDKAKKKIEAKEAQRSFQNPFDKLQWE